MKKKTLRLLAYVGSVVLVVWAIGAFIETPAADRGQALIKAFGALLFVGALVGAAVANRRRKRAPVRVRIDED